MTKKGRNYLLYLDDMLDSMLQIQEYIKNLSLDEFKENKLKTDAVVRNLEVIGEASKHVPDNIKRIHPEIPWKQMYELRNFVVHEYFGIDYENIWKIIAEALPGNIRNMKAIIEEVKRGGSFE